MAATAPASGAAFDSLKALCYANPEFARRYQGWEVVGRGSFGTVVQVSLMGEPVAVKVFTGLDESGKARLRSEFASTVRFTSLSIIRTYSVFDHGDIAWIEMEAVDGPNLEQELARRDRENAPFAFEHALKIALALAEVVAQAHDAGIVHRDIKPANVLLPRSGRTAVKLGDFGIARFVDAAKLTATNGFPGTPRWAAPEAFESRPRTGKPADVYSLSLCLFALFTNNRYPWVIEDDASPIALLTWRAKASPLRLRFFERAMPESLDDVIARGLDRRPSSRPTAPELRDVLADLSTSRSEHAASNGTPRRSALGMPRRVRWAAVTALVILVALGGLSRLSRPAANLPPSGANSPPAPARIPTSPRTDGAVSAVAPLVTARSSPGFIHIRNGAERIAVLRIEAAQAGDGAERSAFQVATDLAPFETADVALDVLSPTARWAGRREAHLTAFGPGGRLVASVPVALP